MFSLDSPHICFSLLFKSVYLIGSCVCCCSHYYCASPKRVCLFQNFTLGHVLQPLAASLLLHSSMLVSVVHWRTQTWAEHWSAGTTSGAEENGHLSLPALPACCAVGHPCHKSSLLTHVRRVHLDSQGYFAWLLYLFLVSRCCSCVELFCLRCGTFNSALSLHLPLCCMSTAGSLLPPAQLSLHGIEFPASPIFSITQKILSDLFCEEAWLFPWLLPGLQARSNFLLFWVECHRRETFASPITAF